MSILKKGKKQGRTSWSVQVAWDWKVLEPCGPKDKPEPKEHYPHHDEGTQVETEYNQHCYCPEEQADEEYSTKNSPDQSPRQKSKHQGVPPFLVLFQRRQMRKAISNISQGQKSHLGTVPKRHARGKMTRNPTRAIPSP